MDQVDVCIVGAGVIGLAVAQRLCSHKAFQRRTVLLLEQEKSFGQHISSRNSEVIHAGIYYPPGSLKAKLCLNGNQLLYTHCRQYQIPHRAVGKFIVAKRSETQQLKALYDRAVENGVSDLSPYSKRQLQKVEPALRADLALFSPSTGIIDSHAYMLSLLHLAQNQGCHFVPLTRVIGVEPDSSGFTVATVSGKALDRGLVKPVVNPDSKSKPQQPYLIHTRKLINCAGLGTQQLAESISAIPGHTIPRLYPCKGDYFTYNGSSPFKSLIYPLPDPQARGLGIHGTLDLDGRLRFGPDAHYVESMDYDVNAEKATGYADAIKHYFPAIDASRLTPAYSGIRPKLAGPGDSPMDFVVQQGQDLGLPGLIQLFGIESPGLTCSLALAEYLLTLPDLQESW